MLNFPVPDSKTWRPGLTRRWLTVVTLAVLLVGCGFQLKGAQRLALSSVAVQPSSGSALSSALSQTLAGSVSVLQGPRAALDAQVVIDILQEQRDTTPVTKTASGEIRELRLRLRVLFRVITPAGRELIPPTELVREQEISYSETQALSKDIEQAAVFRQIQDDMVRQIVRRLSVLPAPA